MAQTMHDDNANLPILYQNAQKTVTLIDLPSSIALAQGLLGYAPPTDTLLSSTPLKEPYPSTEPKSESALANVLKRQAFNRPENYQDFIANGLQEIRGNHHGDWCKPRRILCDDKTTPKSSQKGSASTDYLEQVVDDVGNWSCKRPLLILDQSPDAVYYQRAQELSLQPVHNNRTTSCFLGLLPTHLGSSRIPPKSTFFLSNIDERSVKIFSEAVQKYYSTPSPSAGPGQFDCILLDPPWTNKSVNRSKTYATMNRTFKTRGKLDAMPALCRTLVNHIAPQGMVACWITNSSKVREAALKAFDEWEVELVEEWIWMKTTTTGEPVYDITGLWRKPYEVLLVGRKIDPFETKSSIDTEKPLKRRLVVSVPDLHSRKPNLRKLIEPMMPDPQNYRGLEIFARNLTAGWWSWGDGVLEFNKAEHWKMART